MSLLPSIFERKRRRSPWFFEDVLDLLPDVTNGGLANITLDVQETPSEYIAKFNLPGIEKNQVKVDLTNQLLTVSAEQKEDKEEKEDNYLIRERSCTSMQRSISLPYAGSPDNVKAELRDGVLTIHVKKSPEKQTKTIPIQ